jgi:hypothetical protein
LKILWECIAASSGAQTEVANQLSLEATNVTRSFFRRTAIRTNLGAIFVLLELSRSTWLITSLSPGGGGKMSKHGVSAGNVAALLMRLSDLYRRAQDPRPTPSLVVPAEAIVFNRNGLQDAVVNDRKAQISKLRVTRDFGTWVEADLG